jgi:predicted O-linked N-acetylglucosamine transferase (SPINDLY family)
MNHQIAGRVELAAPLYREILGSEPRHAAANHCLGMLYVQMRQPSLGLPHLLASLQASPQNPDYWLGYLEALLSNGSLDDATDTLALGRQHGLASAAVEDFARRLNARILQLNQKEHLAPATPQPLATRAERRRESREAAKMERALLALVTHGNLADAGPAARALTERFPDRGLGWKTFGALQWADGRPDLALAAMEKSVALLPRDAEALANLGALLTKLERIDEAESFLDKALEIDPALATAYVPLGNVYQLQGRNAEAEAAYRRALSLRSARPNWHEDMRHTSLLFVLSHDPAIGADALFAEHRRVGMAFEELAPSPRIEHCNTREPERRLKIGVVSADLFTHPVATFIEPVLEEMDGHDGLELTAYYNNVVEDETTGRLRRHFARWRPILTLSDAQLEQQIIDDGIDILIDLSGHTSGNRLRAFARKPAPVQASWLGYPGTTGLTAMDYYLTDPIFLPPGEFDRHFTEKLVYLHAFAPFQPHASAPPVNALPALRTGSLRFGSFNRLGKITDASIHLWSQLLLALPSATMLLVGVAPNGRHNPLLGRFMANGITSDRLSFHPRCGMDEYLAQHHQVDLCLDTTPYTGGTTTCHALWMGVPTLTLAGATPASRQSAANQAMIGLVGFCAKNPAEFVERGVYWSAHLAELADVRAQLRTRWEQAPAHRTDLTAAVLICALRQMWRRWCSGRPAQSFEINESRVGKLRKPSSTPSL